MPTASNLSHMRKPKHEIDPRFAGWMLVSVGINQDYEAFSHTCYQLTSSVDMLELFEDRKKWADKCRNQEFPSYWHFKLHMILSFPPTNSVLIKNYTNEDELRFYADAEREAYAKQLS